MVIVVRGPFQTRIYPGSPAGALPSIMGLARLVLLYDVL